MAVRILVLSWAVLIAVIITPLAEASENNTVSFMPAWTVNETAKYLVKKSKTDARGTQSATMPLSVRVAGKTADGYIFECQYDNFDTDIDIPVDLKKILVEINQGMKIKYATDKYGGFQKKINLDEIQAWTEASLARYIASIPDEVVRAGISKLVSDSMKIKGAVSASASREISYLHNPYFLGQEFEVDEKYMAEVILPNIFNPPQPYFGVVFMTASRGGGFKQMLIEQEIDKQKSAVILADTLGKMAVANNVGQPDVNLKITNVELKDFFCYSFKESGNWVEKALPTRKIIVGGYTREETLEFIRQQ